MKTIGEVQKRLPENILTKCGVLIYIYIFVCWPWAILEAEKCAFPLGRSSWWPLTTELALELPAEDSASLWQTTISHVMLVTHW